MKKSLLAVAVLIFVVPTLIIFWTQEVSNGLETAHFGEVSLRVEYALTETEREKGLGGRATIPSDFGMLFVFPRADYYGFWMKDTLVPLDIFWLDDKGQVVWMAQDVATSTYPSVFKPNAPARYVLETAAGFAEMHRIATGTPLSLQKFPTVLK